jgi:hypothetical protein
MNEDSARASFQRETPCPRDRGEYDGVERCGWRMELGARLSLMAAAAAAALAATPARAERIQTFWRLEPVVARAPARVDFGELFFEQRLLPVRMVELTAPLATGSQTLATGTLFYLVFNDEGRIGYCMIKEGSAGAPNKLLSIPILNQRPCLVDSDGDGFFDKGFSSYQKYGGPPTARGSINGATPLPAKVAYRQVDVHTYPYDLRVSFRLMGKPNPAKATIGVKFSRNLGAKWLPVRGRRVGGGTFFSLLNADILLLGVEGKSARIEMRWAEDVYLSTNNHNTLFWGPLPSFVPRG